MGKKQGTVYSRITNSRPVQKCKKLFFSLLVAAPLVSCATDAHAIPRKTPVLDLGKSKHSPRAAKRDSATCRMKGRILEYTLSDGTKKMFPDLLEKGERVLSTSCNDRFASILTNTSLITVPGKKGGAKSDDGISLTFLQSRKDMREMHKTGIVAWAQGLDRSYFLAPDCSVTEVPVFNKEKTVPVHYLPCKARKAQMVFHSGFLFIAPLDKKMFVMKITNSAIYMDLKLPADIPGATFFLKRRRLFFGKKDGKKIEIKIKGNKPTSVRLVAPK
jgi:hypothetical protein